jgi:opacity protein-like surface antigen
MIARWYWLNGPAWESWIGGTGGLVVVSDTYTTNNEVTDRYVVGPRGVTIRTEGYTLGLAAGVSNVLSESWTVGAGFRYGLWFLPNAPARDVLGDEASLIGRVATIVIGINVGYRLQL